MDEFLRFAPLSQERVWGGRALETALGRTLPPGRPIGESWEIVDRPGAQSVVVGGTFAGQTLRQVLEQHSAEIMGPRWPVGKPFPILVKWLDCRERLSLQVHPPAAIAAKLGGEPKTENWFVAAAEPGAHLIVGLKPGVTRAQFEQAVADGTAEGCVNRFPVAAGDSVLVPSGQVHAIDGGNLILEIQQNSDTTYRVHDWGRVGLDGKPRQLHLAESLQSILWETALPSVVKAARKPAVCVVAPEFCICSIPLRAGKTVRIVGRQPRILSVVKGRLTSRTGEIKRGENCILPYAGSFTFTAMEDTLVLVAENFAGSYSVLPDIYTMHFGVPVTRIKLNYGWNFNRLLLAMFCSFIFQAILFPDLCGCGDAKVALGLAFDAVVVLRMILARLRRETCNGWMFYELLCWTSPAWISGLNFLFMGEF